MGGGLDGGSGNKVGRDDSTAGAALLVAVLSSLNEFSVLIPL
jgi:hypothetical protein